ncbi:GNAT family N-acetyltransferase [Cognatilysobacter bugurensis]|uniref:N-acetyltransferase YsnE n=1 Tax=Cognatilysobacter bugurensis TaxID=543356 RepID=A0A918SZP3_9GAMM|nr:GNAT family N-acetyltransferase [Lysobacter bugurensis]GHA81549.1 putative N-acetyltransferase YsnE [Lysobacter bugurensis]
MDIRSGDLEHPAVVALLRGHLSELAGLSPAGSVHALGLERLRAADITFWSAWDGDALLGCAALRQLDALHGEVKSMRTATPHRGRGVAAELLLHLIDEAHRRGYERLSLETGTSAEFAAAHRLYARSGFTDCGPFGDYRPDPHSRFMTRSQAR